MKNYLVPLSILATFLFTTSACKKESSNTPPSSEKEGVKPPVTINYDFRRFKPSENNKSLLYQIDEKISNKKYQFFGDFDEAGEPKTISSIIAYNEENDSLLNLILDESSRVKMFYLSDNENKKDDKVNFIDYLEDGNSSVCQFEIDWESGSRELIKCDSIQNINSSSFKVSDNIFNKALVKNLTDAISIVAAVGIGYLGITVGGTVLGVIGGLTVAMTALSGNEANGAELSTRLNIEQPIDLMSLNEFLIGDWQVLNLRGNIPGEWRAWSTTSNCHIPLEERKINDDFKFSFSENSYQITGSETWSKREVGVYPDGTCVQVGETTYRENRVNDSYQYNISNGVFRNNSQKGEASISILSSDRVNLFFYLYDSPEFESYELKRISN